MWSKVLAYQSGGTTSSGPLPTNTAQRWRSMFVDEIESPVVSDDPWETADNHSPDTNYIDNLVLKVGGLA